MYEHRLFHGEQSFGCHMSVRQAQSAWTHAARQPKRLAARRCRLGSDECGGSLHPNPCTNAGSVLASAVGRYAVDWRTAPLRAGDVIVLGVNTYHMTACNVTREARLSCDTRWCPPVALGAGNPGKS